MKQYAALFDLDGVVLDTEPQYSIFWGRMGRNDFPETPDFATSIKGCTLKHIFENFYPEKAEQERVTRLLNEFEREMDYPYVNGVTDFLHQLKKEGIRLAVVTSSDNAKMENVFRSHPELPGLFDRIFTANDVKVGKPAPDCYLNAGAYFQLPMTQCVVIEDSINGLKAGRASGAKVLGLTTTNPVEEVAKYADTTIPDFLHFTTGQFIDLLK